MPVPALADAQEKSFNTSLDIIKLFTTLASGALAFSIGLTAQATNNYPGGYHTLIIVDWVIFFLAILAGVWAQMNAPRLLNKAIADPNAGSIRGPAVIAVALFLIGVALLGYVLIATARFGPAGIPLEVSSPSQAIAKALDAAGLKTVTKVAAVEYIKGTDPVRPDQSAWHVQLEHSAKPNSNETGTATIDVYIDPVNGCTYVVQKTPHTRSGSCQSF